MKAGTPKFPIMVKVSREKADAGSDKIEEGVVVPATCWFQQPTSLHYKPIRVYIFCR